MMIRFKNQASGIIFDMDGVIINTSKLHEESWMHISKEYGLPWDEKLDFTRDVFGTCSADSARLLFRQHVDKCDLSLICFRKNEIYGELLQKHVKSLIVPGFLNFFNAAVHLDIPVGLATSSPIEEAEFVLKSIGIFNRFSAITCISHVTHPKPHPEIYLKTCSKLGLTPECCTGFEDSITGIKALKSAGMACIAVGTTLTAEKLESEGLKVSLYIKDFNELSCHVSKLNYISEISLNTVTT
jgi:beta-phosphoglucomutase-like phosphatase (HAD superfamily)